MERRVRTTRLLVTSFVALAMFATSATAQTRRINGRVTQAGSNEPVASATVSIVSTTLGAITDAQGRFSINAPAGPQSIRVRRIGYQPRTVAVSASLSEIDISLNRDVLELDKQVITGTATTVSSANAANAVTVISDQQLNRVPAQ